MINKYPGTCSCGTSVAAGAGEAVRENGRWVVRCNECATKSAFDDGYHDTTVSNALFVADTPYKLISGHVASDHQAAVFDHFRTSQSSAIIKAVAGAGKTTSIKNAIRYLPEWMSVQLLAFNVEAASQLKAAIEELTEIDAGKRHYRQVRANTFHSVCMQALRRYLALPDTQIKIDDGKVRRLMRERIGNTPIGAETVKLYSSFVTQLVGLAKGEGIGCLVPDTDERWWGIIDHHGLYLDSAEANEKTAVEIARRVMVWSEETARAGWLDYNDQLYLTVLWKLNLWQNHVVVVDEAQDTNPIRRAIARLLLRKGGRLYAVGDPKQCHPAGTQVWVSGEGYKAIESLKVGEQVMTYCHGYFPGKMEQGRKIRAIAKRWFEGELITISADGKSHEVTPNHRCLVRLTDKPGTLVYVMCQGNKARVGRCKSKHGGDFGMAGRARQEKADKAWVIKFFDNDVDAKLMELTIAYKFGLPQLCFYYMWENSGITLEQRQKFWENYPNNIENLEKCLIEFGLDIGLPFWSKDDSTHVGSKYSFITSASNIQDNWMKVCLFDSSPHYPRWEIVNTSRRYFAGEVWSLDVEPNEVGRSLYVANDIVTHNSIYGFTGASTDAMNLIASEFNARELPLTVSYRCAKSIVERAKTWVPYIEASDFAPEGEVLDDAPLANALGMLSAKDAVLCRQTAPLVSLAYGLISRGRACRILGRDIGEGLVNLIEQQRAKGIDNLIKKLETWRNREVSKFNAKGEEGRAEAVEDRIECIMVLINALPETERTVPTLIRKISSMFDDDKKSQLLTLCTVHKAKGKEWDRVTILRPELMPSKAARQEWQQEQEINLMYVAATRAKETLIYCKPGDMALVKPLV